MIFPLLTKYPDLILSILFAAITTLFVPFSLREMAGSINTGLLAILFCLMAIVAGLRKYGLLLALYGHLLSAETTLRTLARFFIFICFFGSMLITNDISLIVFVPLSMDILVKARERSALIPLITLMTIAANMGSMLTPVGNPQNLFIYSYYHTGLLEFLSVTGPVVLVSGAVLYLSTFLFPGTAAAVPGGRIVVQKKQAAVLLLLFAACLLQVLRILPLSWLLLLVVPVLFVMDRSLFRKVDYKLLLLFTFLFLGVGNLSRMDAVRTMAVDLLSGHEFLVSLLLSQVLSNVPTTVMLAACTDEWRPLLLGVNIGGLGTLIASMASLISFRAYASLPRAARKKYLGVFSAYNLVLLAILILWAFLQGV